MKQDASSDPASGSLRRELGLFGAVMMGLGSIVGTGVFVSMGIAAGVAGPAVTLAVVIGALVLGGLYALFGETVLFSSRYKHDRKCYA